MSDSGIKDIKGIGKKTAEKLEDQGYTSIKSLATASVGDLSEKEGISENKAKKILSSARDEVDVGGFKTAYEIDQNEKYKIPTLVPELDEILGGGVQTGTITEVHGENSSGKSQVVHQLCVNVQLPEEVGGLHGRPLVIDTERAFKARRVKQMVRGLEDDVMKAAMEEEDSIDEVDVEDSEKVEKLADKFLERVHVATAQDHDHQIILGESKVQELASKYEEDDYPVRLVAVDSIISKFRAEMIGRGQLSARQQKISKHLDDLYKVAKGYNVAVFLTNQMQSDPNSRFGPSKKPVGGNVLGHTSTYRLRIKPSKKNKRLIEIRDAPDLPEEEGLIKIEPEGIKPA